MPRTIAACILAATLIASGVPVRASGSDPAALSGKAWTQIIVGGAAAVYFGIKLEADVNKVHGAVNEADTFFDRAAFSPPPYPAASAPAGVITLHDERVKVIEAVIGRVGTGETQTLPGDLRTFLEDYRVCWNSVVAKQPSADENAKKAAGDTQKTGADKAGAPPKKPLSPKPGSNKALFTYQDPRAIDVSTVSGDRDAADASDTPPAPSCQSLLKDLAALQTEESRKTLVGLESNLAAAQAALARSGTALAAANRLKPSTPAQAKEQSAQIAAAKNAAAAAQHEIALDGERIPIVKAQIVAHAFPVVLANIDQIDLANAVRNAPSLGEQIVVERVGSFATANGIRAHFLVDVAPVLLARLAGSPKALFQEQQTAEIQAQDSVLSDISGVVKGCYTASGPLDCLTSLNTLEGDIVSGMSQAASCKWARTASIPTLTAIEASQSKGHDGKPQLNSADPAEVAKWDFGAPDGC